MSEEKRIFSDSVDYKEILSNLKDEFQKRYNETETSSGNLEEFKMLTVLGQGAFGVVVEFFLFYRICFLELQDVVVKLVTHEPTGKFYAMKILQKEKIIKGKQLKHTLDEKRILKSIDYPFLVNMEFSLKDNNYLYFVMPFVNGGEMFTHWRNAKRFSEAQAKFYGAQVALAIEYLHYLNIIYRDLKPENIMIDASGYIKITDFGFCKFVEGRTYTFCGTPEYLAPEIIQSKGYGKSVDWWSFGVLIYELVAGYSPFFVGSSDQMELFSRIVAGKFKMSSSFSYDLRSLLKHLLQTDITRRYGNLKNGPNDIKQHRWFKGTEWIKILNREIEAPFIPQVSGPGDTSQFDKYRDISFRQSDKCKFEKEFADF